MSDTLTWAEVERAFSLVCPPLYYNTMDDCDLGHIYYARETEGTPEYIVCHPDDFDEIKNKIMHRRTLVHIRDYVPSLRGVSWRGRW